MPLESLADVPSQIKKHQRTESSIDIQWFCELEAALGDDETQPSFKDVWDANDEKLPIRAEVLDTTTNKNRWKIPVKEIDNIINQIKKGIPVKKDHKKDDIDVIVGKLTDAEKMVEEGITKLFAKGFLNNRQTAKQVFDGTLKGISPHGYAIKQTCTECGANMIGKRKCTSCGNMEKYAEKWEIDEFSLTDTPAYKNSEVKALTFSASIDRFLDNEQATEEDDLSLEASQMDEKEKKELESLRAENDKLKAKCKAAEEKDKKDEEEKAKAEEEEKEKKEAEAKAHLAEIEKQNEELKAALEKQNQNAGVGSQGEPGGTPVDLNSQVITELSAHFDRTGQKNPFEVK